MPTLATLALSRGLVDEPQMGAAFDAVMRFGGDVGTNLFAIGAVDDEILHHLYAEQLQLPPAPSGPLPRPAEALRKVWPLQIAKRHRAQAISMTSGILVLGVDRLLPTSLLDRLETRVGKRIQMVSVTPLRLTEALWRSGGPTPTDRERTLIGKLTRGKAAEVMAHPQPFAPASDPDAPPRPYRRMSERPEGIVPSESRAKRKRFPTNPLPMSETPPSTARAAGAEAVEMRRPRRRIPTPAQVSAEGATLGARGLLEAVPSFPPAALDAPAVMVSQGEAVVGEGDAIVAEVASDTVRSEAVTVQPRDDVETVKPRHTPVPPGPFEPSDTASLESGSQGIDSGQPSERPKRDTNPWTNADEEEKGDRTTNPWADDDENPVSIRSFRASLSDTAPRMSEPPAAVSAFRHRGPFTLAQAERAAARAEDVDSVLQIVMRFARQFFERTLLTVMHGEFAEGRIVHGLPPDVAGFRVQANDGEVIRMVLNTAEMTVESLSPTGADQFIDSRLGAAGRAIAIIPVQLRGRVVAILFGDDREGVDESSLHDVAEFADYAATAIARVILTRKQSVVVKR